MAEAAGRSHGGRPGRIKWTHNMVQDLLACKDKAIGLTNSQNPPLLRNGRKKGYMGIMKELWDDLGYAGLGLSAQNLRDHAAKADRNLESASSGGSCASIEAPINPEPKNGLGNLLKRNADKCSNLDLHISFDQASVLHINDQEQDMQRPQGQAPIQCENTRGLTTAKSTEQYNQPAISGNNNEAATPGKLPEYNHLLFPSSVFWGQDPEGRAITVNVSTIEDAYDEIVKWRKNTFLVPYGKIGREFIDKFTEHINDWNNGSPSQHVALKAAIVLLAVGLQKPSQKSKAKEHQERLGKRLDQWNRGEIGSLLREGRAIQRRLINSHRQSKPESARVFANLVMSGQINSALRYLSKENRGGVLPLTDDVMKQLREKHPEAQEAQLGTLVFGPTEQVPDSIFQQIKKEMVREAALKTKGSGGPSGVDSNGFRRMMACKSFRKSGTNLCSAIATMTRKLCTEYVDPRSIEAILANRLIPLDKGEGKVRPIGVGEVIRRIMGKCVMSVTKQDVIDACGSMQTCAGHKSGSEAAVHAMRSIFDADDTDAVLLIDASNAFNSLEQLPFTTSLSFVHQSQFMQSTPTVGMPGSSSWAEKSYSQLKEPLKETRWR